jgi:hypothetical protein
MGSIIILHTFCAILSLTVGIPKGLSPQLALGIMTRFTAIGL